MLYEIDLQSALLRQDDAQSSAVPPTVAVSTAVASLQVLVGFSASSFNVEHPAASVESAIPSAPQKLV